MDCCEEDLMSGRVIRNVLGEEGVGEAKGTRNNRVDHKDEESCWRRVWRSNGNLSRNV